MGDERAEAHSTTHRASVGAISQMGKLRPRTGQGDPEPQQGGLGLGWRLACALPRASLSCGAERPPWAQLHLSPPSAWRVISAAMMLATPRFSFPALVTGGRVEEHTQALGPERKQLGPAGNHASLRPLRSASADLSRHPVSAGTLPGDSG